MNHGAPIPTIERGVSIDVDLVSGGRIMWNIIVDGRHCKAVQDLPQCEKLLARAGAMAELAREVLDRDK